MGWTAVRPYGTVSPRMTRLKCTLAFISGQSFISHRPPERLTVTDREAALRKISVGDMFHASVRGHTDGPSYPCLTLQVREDAIFAVA